MDPLSVTASIIAIVQLTGVIIGCLNDLKGTSKDRAQCAMEISNVSSLLVTLMYRLEEVSSNDGSYGEVQALAAADGHIDQYRSALEQLQSKLTSSTSSRTKIGGALSWKFGKEEIANILGRIERLKSLTQIALGIDHFKLSQALKTETTVISSKIKSMQTDTIATKVGVKSIQESHDSEQYRVVMDWLSSTDFPAQQSDIISKRQEGTGKWFVESLEFANFLQGAKQTLFCPGIPGAGKTMISAIAVDHIRKAFQGDNVGVAYIYNNYNRQEEQVATKLVAAILKQLVQGRPLYGEPVTALHKQHAGEGTRPSLAEICTSLNSVLNSYSKVYIIIDALDEYTDNEGIRSELITMLRTVQTSTNTSLMVTSRPDLGTEKLFQGTPELKIQANDADVKQYVVGRLDRFPKCVRNDEELQAEIQDGIVRAVDGMFLLAPLHLDSLEDEITKKAIRSGLKNLPRGSAAVNETYDKAIKRIERQPLKRSERAKTVLSWITYAERQLTTTELCHALAVEEGDSELDEDNIPDIEDITSVCAGLVAVDKESNVIRLVHYTTQEYFRGIRETWNPKAQEEIASTCLTYLSFQTFSTGHCNNDEEFESRILQNPFLDYAARYWGTHALTVQQAIKDLALPFLCNMNQLSCSTQIMFLTEYNYRGYSQRTAKNQTGIHVAAVFGMAYLLQELMPSDGNKDCIHIHAHDSSGRDDVVVDSKDTEGWTPLSWAARSGHEAIVELLVRRDDVVADSKDTRGWTPLSWAARSGHEAIVELLIKRDDVVADSKDKTGRTPLSLAAGQGQEAVVKLLVKRDDVIADLEDGVGQTPLSLAAQGGHEAVVKLLVERDDVIANLRDNSGRTPLLWAAESGHEAVVKLLLDRDDVVVDSKDNDGRTPLSYAADEGHKAIVKLLIKRGDVVADSKDNDGRTPLSIAAEYGHEEIVQLFLKRNDVDPSSKDNNGHTPLWWVANSSLWVHESRREAFVKLLERDIIPDSKDKDGRTPLSIAAERGFEAGIRLLLERNDVDPSSKDNNGRTPLWWTLLLERNDVDPNSKDKDGHTPLCWATESSQDDNWWLTAEEKREAVAMRKAIAKLLTHRIAEDNRKRAQTEDHLETTS
ncbi:hypothetical protein VE00_10222 [Pseudogymnoascus sp. WSF 3629]|nr:hypothetical protein VE00_10222 [Pseudogymnoascus sp. WSF 3629]